MIDKEKKPISLLNPPKPINKVVYPCIVLSVNGKASDLLPKDRINCLKTIIAFDLKVTGVFLLIDRAGISGTTEIDLKINAPDRPWVSILKTKPSVDFSAGDDATSTNAVLDPRFAQLMAGDTLSVDVKNTQLNGKSFMIRIDYEKEGLE